MELCKVAVGALRLAARRGGFGRAVLREPPELRARALAARLPREEPRGVLRRRGTASRRDRRWGAALLTRPGAPFSGQRSLHAQGAQSCFIPRWWRAKKIGEPQISDGPI